MDLISVVGGHFHWSRDEMLFEIDLVEMWIWRASAIEHNGWLNFAGVMRKGLGFIEKHKTENG